MTEPLNLTQPVSIGSPFTVHAANKAAQSVVASMMRGNSTETVVVDENTTLVHVTPKQDPGIPIQKLVELLPLSLSFSSPHMRGLTEMVRNVAQTGTSFLDDQPKAVL